MVPSCLPKWCAAPRAHRQVAGSRLLPRGDEHRQHVAARADAGLRSHGFIDAYAGLVCNHSDPGGRYALDQQPAVGYWNLQKLAQALAGHVDGDALAAALAEYEHQLMLHYSELMRAKLGLAVWEDDDPALFRELFRLLAAHGWITTCSCAVSVR